LKEDYGGAWLMQEKDLFHHQGVVVTVVLPMSRKGGVGNKKNEETLFVTN